MKDASVSNPNGLFDVLIREGDLKNDAALAKALGVHSPTISNMRALRLRIGATLIIKIMEEFDMPLARIRLLLSTQN